MTVNGVSTSQNPTGASRLAMQTEADARFSEPRDHPYGSIKNDDVGRLGTSLRQGDDPYGPQTSVDPFGASRPVSSSLPDASAMAFNKTINASDEQSSMRISKDGPPGPATFEKERLLTTEEIEALNHSGRQGRLSSDFAAADWEGPPK